MSLSPVFTETGSYTLTRHHVLYLHLDHIACVLFVLFSFFKVSGNEFISANGYPFSGEATLLFFYWPPFPKGMKS